MPAGRVGGALALLMVLLGAAPSYASDDEPARADLVRLPIAADDGTLTPYTFQLAYPLVTLVYDTLLWRDAGGVPRPWLAESVETSADGLVVTIRLREGARWHDGQELTAGDVVFTFDHVAARFHPRFTPQLAAVEAVEAADPRTVLVTLRAPAPGFVDQPLADLPILPAHLWEGLPEGAEAPPGPAVGSGPYRLVEYDPGEAYRFEADPDYVLGAPQVDAIEVPVIAELDDTIAALERGQVDMIPATLPERAQGRLEGPGIRFARGPVYTGTTLLLNTRRPPFENPVVRRGVAAALDLERLAGAVGGVVPADRGYLHPESRWTAGTLLHAFSPEAATAALADLAEVAVLAAEGDAVRAEAGRQVALALGRVGVDAAVTPVSRAELGQAVGEDGSTPDFDAAVWSMPALASYDPDFVPTMFGSDPVRSVLNYSGYTSAAFDALADRVATVPDLDTRQAAVDEQLALLAEDAPAVPLFYPEGAFAFRPEVYDGWVFVEGSGILDKRSFLALDDDPASDLDEEPAPVDDPAPAGDPAASPPLGGGGPAVGPLGLAALALAALVVLLAAAELLRRRR